jgi:hypothetical protein
MHHDGQWPQPDADEHLTPPPTPVLYNFSHHNNTVATFLLLRSVDPRVYQRDALRLLVSPGRAIDYHTHLLVKRLHVREAAPRCLFSPPIL